MIRRHFGAAAALGPAALLAIAVLLASCSPRLGWGLVLWTAPDGPLPAGSIVPVYIKSNIQKVYVVGVPGSKGKKAKKIELPLWQIELYPSRRKAVARVKSMGANMSLYMIAARDGLPLRDTPSNAGRRVYRLREGQSVKVLARAEGEEVSTGGQVLPGSWYQVLTEDGTQGYVFSYALRLYDEAKEGPPVIVSAKQALSGRVDLIFSRAWRPEYFQEMLDDNRIYLDYFSPRFGVFVDAIRRQVRIELPAASKVFDYSGISETDGTYVFEGTPLRIRIESDTRMVCSWTGDDSVFKDGAEAGATDDGDGYSDAAATPDTVAPSRAAETTGAAVPAQPPPAAQPMAVESYEATGSSGSAVFVVLTSDPLQSIRLEALRRQNLLVSFVDGVGGSWSVSVGTGSATTQEGALPSRLEIHKNGRFTWKGRSGAAAALFPADAGEDGDLAFRLFVDPAISSSWSGAFSIRFDQADSGRSKWFNFLYRRSPAGLVLAAASVSPGSLDAQAADPRTEALILQPATE